MHLMTRAIETIRSKGHEITEEEALGATIAILMHDIGHGPYSHTLEYSLVNGVNHEVISSLFMDELNHKFKGQLSLAIEIFKGTYPKKFLHQLVSSQLDVDRLDYLKRDSFFTGVSEGVIGSERLISMLNVADGEIAVEAKGIYSVEKFLVARRIMYWQVYLHKTVLGAEMLLIKILSRAKSLALSGETLFCSSALETFLYHDYTKEDFYAYNGLLAVFARLDDFDIMGAIKVWAEHDDAILSTLCGMLIHRKLYKVEIRKEPFTQEEIEAKQKEVAKHMSIDDPADLDFFVFSDQVMNRAYSQTLDNICILFKDGIVKDVAEAADLLNISVLSEPVTKYFLCYPKIA
jgi:HD superfamily phosphohydrolase